MKLTDEILKLRIFMSGKEKNKYISKYYLLHNKKKEKILDVEIIEAPHYIYDGLALKFKSGWRFGCPEKFIIK